MMLVWMSCVLLAIVVQGNIRDHSSHDNTPGGKLEKIDFSGFSWKFRGNRSNEIGGNFGKMWLKKHPVFRGMVEAHSLEGVPLPDPDDEEEEVEAVEEEEEETVIDEDDPEELAIHQRPIIPSDENLFPEDCAILYKITADWEARRTKNSPSVGSSGGPSPESVILLTSVGILLKIVSNN